MRFLMIAYFCFLILFPESTNNWSWQKIYKHDNYIGLMSNSYNNIINYGFPEYGTDKSILQCLDTKHCRAEFNKYNDYGSCYNFHYEQKTYTQAREYCKGIDGYLIIINSQQEWDLVRRNLVPAEYGYWVGLTDFKEEGKYEWDDGTTVTNESWWSPGEPDNKEFNTNCGFLDFVKKNITSDSCVDNYGNKRIAFCEKEISSNSTCEKPWKQNLNGCYHLHSNYIRNKILNWNDLRELCQEFEGDLLVINDREEWNWVITTYVDVQHWFVAAIGLNNVAKGHDTTSPSWLWTDNTTFIADNVDGIPLLTYQNENCGAFVLRNGTYHLHDFPCDVYNHNVICESDAVTSFCHWPPPRVDPVNMTLTCATQDEIPIDCLSNLFETGTHIILECKSSYESSTGFPLAITICQESGDWTSVEAFKCG